MTPFTAVVLAGRRAGVPGELADAHKVSDKCLIPIDGVPLIERVVGMLAATTGVGQIVVSVNDPAILRDLPVCGGLLDSGRVIALPASENIAASVLDATAASGFPALVTTADNVLLTAEAAAQFVSAMAGADAGAAFAPREAILAAHPEGQRRFYEFADGAYSNCNLYWLGTARGAAAIETFREGGQFMKNPGRIAKAFGIFNLLMFRAKLLSLSSAFKRISGRFGVTIIPHVFADGSLAIDVDNQRTYDVALELLQKRAS